MKRRCQAEGFEQCKEMAAKAFDVRRIYGAAIVRALQYPGQQAEEAKKDAFPPDWNE